MRLHLFRLSLLLGLLGVATSSFAAPPDRPVVAVLYFDTPDSGAQADDLKGLRKGLAELTIADLDGTGTMTVVERARLEGILSELELQASGKVDPSTAQKIGKLLGAKYLVWGSLFVVPAVKGANLMYTTKVVTVETGVAKQRKHTGSLEAFAELQSTISTDASELVSSIEATAPAPQPEKPKETKVGTKPSLPNALKYSKALDAKDKKDLVKAKQLLTEVTAAQPDFKLAQLDLLNLSK